MLTATGLSRSEIEAAGSKTIRRAGKQVLVIAHEGRIFAIANRCPHEGYPLSEGNIGPGCILTCNWHNWKFDLASGEALVGRDQVRSYTVAEQNGEIFLDFTDPPAEAQRGRALKGLDAAIADYDTQRMAREAARLERAGYDARGAIVHAIRGTARRFEDGTTHAHAAAADWLALADRAETPEQRLAANLEPLAHIAWDIQGAGTFPYAEEVEPWDAEAFLAAMEDEYEAIAMSYVRGAIAAGIPYVRLRPAFAEAALSHYADFGHSAIYTLKTGELIARLNDDVTEPLLLLLTRSLVRATREERLPEFRFYRTAQKLWSEGGNAPLRSTDLVHLNPDAILKRLLSSAKRPVHELYDALLGAAAWNLLHYDLTFDCATDNAIADNIGWLDFTHALTFANAARHLCEESPALWPKALLQMALFVGRNAKYVTVDDEERWAVDDRAAFFGREKSALYDHGIPEPIIACHRLKVLFALEDELRASPNAPWAEAMCAGVNRYLHSPHKRRHGLRLATQALDFIAKEG